MNVCGDVVLAVYGPETVSVDETPTTAVTMSQAAAAAAAADGLMTTTAAASKSVELNVPEILVHN